MNNDWDDGYKLRVGGTTGYTPGGTDVALADGGTGASLTDPNADRILFWDDSAGAVTWLTAGSGLTITDTTMTSTGSGGMTLLGTLTPTSGTTADLTSLTLTSYKALFIVIKDIQHGSGTNNVLRLGGKNLHALGFQDPDTVSGTVWLGLVNGIGSAVVGKVNTDLSVRVIDTSYTTASTSISFDFNIGASFDGSGTILVYGVA